jgi:hypothetical protein
MIITADGHDLSKCRAQVNSRKNGPKENLVGRDTFTWRIGNVANIHDLLYT